MPAVLIIDACKPSLVMSSEIFKDKITGCEIIIAGSGREALEALEARKPNMCVVDFDLPDVDGVTLIQAMRRTFSGPILLTAYPDAVVEQAVLDDLFAFNDAGGWIAKPVKFDDLSIKIDRFLVDKYRLGKRFDFDLSTQLIGKGAGRGKRAPKASGKIINLSLGGACVAIDGPMAVTGGDEITVTLTLPSAAGTKAVRTKQAKSTTSPANGGSSKLGSEAKIKCSVAWFDKKNSQAGIAFSRLSEVQKRGLEQLLRNQDIA